MRLIIPGNANGIEEVGPFGRIYIVRGPRSPFNRHYRVITPLAYLAPGGPVAEILARERPDVVEICDKYTLPLLGALLRGGWLSGLKDRPTVIGLTCERMDENVAAYATQSAPGQWFSRLYMRWFYYRMFDRHFAVSEHTAAEIRAAGPRCPAREPWLCPLGADVDRFHPGRRSETKRQELLDLAGGSGQTVLLLYAGRLVPEKNLGLLFQTMEQLVSAEPDRFRLLVAGEGIERALWTSECERRIPRTVVFLGHKADPEELADLYANCDIFVHPNPREPFGIAPLEAMASGIPLVAPNAGGLLTYASGANAWLADPTPAAFTQAILQVLTGAEERRIRVAAARDTAERRSWPDALAAMERLYQEAHAIRTGVAPCGMPPVITRCEPAPRP